MIGYNLPVASRHALNTRYTEDYHEIGQVNGGHLSLHQTVGNLEVKLHVGIKNHILRKKRHGL